MEMVTNHPYGNTLRDIIRIYFLFSDFESDTGLLVCQVNIPQRYAAW